MELCGAVITSPGPLPSSKPIALGVRRAMPMRSRASNSSACRLHAQQQGACPPSAVLLLPACKRLLLLGPMTAPAKEELSADFRKQLISRLSSVSDLRLPASLTRDKPYPDQQALTAYLSQLLRRDPAVFLERYSTLLSTEDLSNFKPLRSDYEIDYWIRKAEASQPSTTASTGSKGHLTTTAKNRRLAYMYQLEQQGEYFSETSMREREPLVWHQHIGQYEGHPVPPARPQQSGLLGFADSLLRAHDEAQIRARLEQQLEEEECQMSEHDSDSEDEPQQQQQATELPCQATAADGAAAQQQHGQQQQQPVDMSQDAMAQRRQDFLDEMQSRFLTGMDKDSIDYAVIDADAGLDDAWAEQQAQDAVDAYFNAD
eukprot:GHUV01032175.1.p1 GENE.GHUV01032175.1~~GHUV01032175.1.p1  ORF type:complete len:373 (-),score=58.49 GHUV01032175.1:318-1436(-)